MAHRRLGLTLLEVCTVIAMVTLLVTLLAPALAHLRQQQRQVNCQANLGVLGRALLTYANEHGGWLPPGPVERAFWPGDRDRGSPIELYDRTRTTAAPPLSSQQGWYGLGLVWKMGHLDAGAAYYCPQAPQAGGPGLEQAWPQSFDAQRTPADGKTHIYMTYAYRGGLCSQGASALGPRNVLRDSGLLGLVADSPLSGTMWHPGGYSVSYLDTHAAFVPAAAPPIPAGRLQDFWPLVEAD